MTYDAWIIFATFWVVFVTTPGPNAVNCITTGMTFGFRTALWSVLGILCQATLFLTVSALGVTALVAASPALFEGIKLLGALILIGLGVRGFWLASVPPRAFTPSRKGLVLRAFLIATINAKSVAGYLAAFSQFVQPDVPIQAQMAVIFPTALALTTLSYTGYAALGAGLGKLALGAVFNVWFRRAMALCFIAYGVALALS